MKLGICLFFIALGLNQTSVLAQTPSIHPVPGNVTWCPDEFQTFEVRTDGAQQTGCKYLWTVTNGVIFNSVNNRQAVDITWNDFAGNGTLTVTLTNCTAATNTTATNTYAIRSLVGTYRKIQ